jgi:hypothetical protein
MSGCIGETLHVFFADDAHLRAPGTRPLEQSIPGGVFDRADPDGYKLYFETPTDVPEETVLAEPGDSVGKTSEGSGSGVEMMKSDATA